MSLNNPLDENGKRWVGCDIGCVVVALRAALEMQVEKLNSEGEDGVNVLCSDTFETSGGKPHDDPSIMYSAPRCTLRAIEFMMELINGGKPWTKNDFKIAKKLLEHNDTRTGYVPTDAATIKRLHAADGYTSDDDEGDEGEEKGEEGEEEQNDDEEVDGEEGAAVADDASDKDDGEWKANDDDADVDDADDDDADDDDADDDDADDDDADDDPYADKPTTKKVKIEKAAAEEDDEEAAVSDEEAVDKEADEAADEAVDEEADATKEVEEDEKTADSEKSRNFLMNPKKKRGMSPTKSKSPKKMKRLV